MDRKTQIKTSDIETFMEKIETFEECDFVGDLTRSEAEMIQDYFKDENIAIEYDVCNCDKQLNATIACRRCGLGGNSAVYCVRLERVKKF